MLEPDVTRRANMKQVSQSSWLKQTTIDSRQGSSENKDDSSDVNPTFNQCRCTHTVPICMTHRLQSSSAEYNCRNASDDSE